MKYVRSLLKCEVISIKWTDPSKDSGEERGGIDKTHLRFRISRPRHRWSTPPPVALGSWRCGGPWTLAGGEFFFFFRLFFGVFEMLRRRLHPEIRIRFSLSYPRSGRVPSIGRGRLESCAWLICWDPDDFHICSFVQFHVNLFRSMIVVIGDGCCSGTLVFWGLNMTTSRLSTTTNSSSISFAQLQWYNHR
jgi:hypothetical protein